MGTLNISGLNSGPNSSKVSTPQAEMGPRSSSAAFNHSISASLGVGPYNDLGLPVLGAPYSNGYTNRFLLTAATNGGAGTTINGIDSTNIDDGWTGLIVNPSTTDPLIFTHLNGGSQPNNQFSNENAGSVQIGAARLTFIVSKWQFA
jgi:hypothetical protein